LEVRQARGRVWCLVVMAPLEVPQGQVSAVARSREELLVFQMSYVIGDVQDDQGVPTSDDGVVLFRGRQYKVDNNKVLKM
jgi:hypothetical protein